jgi:hypothetical protein
MRLSNIKKTASKVQNHTPDKILSLRNEIFRQAGIEMNLRANTRNRLVNTFEKSLLALSECIASYFKKSNFTFFKNDSAVESPHVDQEPSCLDLKNKIFE